MVQLDLARGLGEVLGLNKAYTIWPCLGNVGFIVEALATLRGFTGRSAS